MKKRKMLFNAKFRKKARSVRKKRHLANSKRGRTMTELEIVTRIFTIFTRKAKGNVIPIALRAPSLVGTVQDDPFDHWVQDLLRKEMPDMEVVKSGSLTTPDTIIRHRPSKTIVALEVKKLLQKDNGQDARGMTMDYNSCLPCGQALLKVGEETIQVPCFYLFCLLSGDSKEIRTLVLMDGDFLNYDFNLHKKAKYSNVTEYNHGPYGEGSIRHRDMYTYPNPLNAKLNFHLRNTLVVKKHDAEKSSLYKFTTEFIQRDDIFNNSFLYSVIDPGGKIPSRPTLVKDIFRACKIRTKKERIAAIPRLEKI